MCIRDRLLPVCRRRVRPARPAPIRGLRRGTGRHHPNLPGRQAPRPRHQRARLPAAPPADERHRRLTPSFGGLPPVQAPSDLRWCKRPVRPRPVRPFRPRWSNRPCPARPTAPAEIGGAPISYATRRRARRVAYKLGAPAPRWGEPAPGHAGGLGAHGGRAARGGGPVRLGS